VLSCAWCGAPREMLIFARSHRTPRGQHYICSVVYHCRECNRQTGTVQAEPRYPSNAAAVTR
jgi:hypothetical protein